MNKKKRDALAEFLKKAEAEAYCLHQHLKFDAAGSMLKCMECPRVWAPLNASGIDYLYSKPQNANRTRNDPFVVAKIR